MVLKHGRTPGRRTQGVFGAFLLGAGTAKRLVKGRFPALGLPTCTREIEKVPAEEQRLTLKQITP